MSTIEEPASLAIAGAGREATGLRRRLRAALWRADQLLSVALAAANVRLRSTALGAKLHDRHFGSLAFSTVEVALAGAPSQGLRLAFVSDLHAGPFMDGDDLSGIFERLARLEPDLLCLGGDLVSTSLDELSLLLPALGLVNPPLGRFVVPGNHEYHDGSPAAAHDRFFDRHGYVVLRNRGVRIAGDGGSFWLAGIDDLRRGEPDLRAALAGQGDSEPTVLLSHNPDIFPLAAAAGVDLTLSGHTHGGQIRLFGWAPLTNSRFRFRDGPYRDGSSTMYVGRGAGTSTIPLRVGAPPEIPIVRIVAPAPL